MPRLLREEKAKRKKTVKSTNVSASKGTAQQKDIRSFFGNTHKPQDKKSVKKPVTSNEAEIISID